MARPNVADQLIEEVESLHLNSRGYPASSFQEALATVIDMAQPAALEDKLLAVEKAYPNDSGLNMARMHPQTLDQLSIDSADVIEAVGDRTTVAVARPMDGGDARRGAVRIDGFTRGNAGVDPGEHVVVRPITVDPADGVVFEAADENLERLGDAPAEYVREEVIDRVVSIGDTVPVIEPSEAPFSGTPGKAVPLTVAEIEPGGPHARLASRTDIEVKRE